MNVTAVIYRKAEKNLRTPEFCFACGQAIVAGQDIVVFVVGCREGESVWAHSGCERQAIEHLHEVLAEREREHIIKL